MTKPYKEASKGQLTPGDIFPVTQRYRGFVLGSLLSNNFLTIKPSSQVPSDVDLDNSTEEISSTLSGEKVEVIGHSGKEELKLFESRIKSFTVKDASRISNHAIELYFSKTADWQSNEFGQVRPKNFGAEAEKIIRDNVLSEVPEGQKSKFRDILRSLNVDKVTIRLKNDEPETEPEPEPSPGIPEGEEPEDSQRKMNPLVIYAIVGILAYVTAR